MKQEKEKKTKKIPLWKTLTVAFLLLGIFVAVGYSTFIAGPVVDTSSTIQTSGETETGDSDTVRVDFKYQICDGMEVVEHEPEAIGTIQVQDITGGTQSPEYYDVDLSSMDSRRIRNKADYEQFQDIMYALTNRTLSTLPAEDNPYIFPGISPKSTLPNNPDLIDYDIYLEVTSTIQDTISACSIHSYSGQYKIYKVKHITTTYDYDYHSDIKKTIYLKRGDAIPVSTLQELVQTTGEYTYIGLREEVVRDGVSQPSSEFFDETNAVSKNMVLYVVMNSNSSLSSLKNLSDTINKIESGEVIFNGGVAEGDYNIRNDLSFFEEDNVVFLTKETNIKEGVTINLGLNNGRITQTSTMNSSNFEPENNAHSLQYKISLQADLVIDGTLLIGANYGSSASGSNQGQISDEYVCLDLNGHDIIVNPTGKLISYGLIKDSVGTGTIQVKGGSLTTLVTIQDYHGGSTTLTMYQKKEFPFWIYAMPYLRCHVCLSQYNGNWGRLFAQCYICALTTGGAQYTDPTLNFIGPQSSSEGNFLFALQATDNSDAQVDIYGYSLESMGKDATASDLQKCYTWRTEISLNNVSCIMQSVRMTLKLTITANIDTQEYIFPISSFFDISMFSSELTVSQKIRFMPGASFIADEDSIIFLEYDGDNVAQISALNRGYYYYDAKYGGIINKDNHQYTDSNDKVVDISSAYTIVSTAFWKYLSGSRVKVYGTIAFKEGNSGSEDYLLAGNIDFSRIAYYSDPSDLHYVDDSVENPFASLVQKGSISISTYDYATLLGFESYHSGGYALPLVSHGTCYYQDKTDLSTSKVGTFDSLTGVLQFEDKQYYFDCTTGKSFKLRDEDSCSLKECTYDESTHIFTDSSTQKQYIYFAGMYCDYVQNSDGTATANISRLTETLDTVNVKFDTAKNRWLRA